MSFFVVAAITVSTVYTATQQKKAGKRQAEMLMVQKREEELQAKAEELARREELNAVLAANQVAMATSGISGTTPESIALESARTISSSESAVGLSTRLKAAQRERQASNAIATANAQAAGTLLSGATSTAMYMKK